MKHPISASIAVIFSVLLLASCSNDAEVQVPEASNSISMQADVMGAASDLDLDVDYVEVDKILADISVQMHQPNVLKEDILRGWYLGGKSDRKYGTPDTWIFVDDGANSKWMSPNSLEEEDLIDARELCRQTAGQYQASCLDSADEDCAYIHESQCQCSAGTKWADGQGCIMVTDRGSFISVNNSELNQGFYLGFPNQKKLNTPSDWSWVEEGRQSMWQKN